MAADAVGLLAAGHGGGPAAALRSIFLGLVVILAIIALFNFKKASVLMAIGLVLVMASTIAFMPDTAYQAIGGGGGRFVSWVANKF